VSALPAAAAPERAPESRPVPDNWRELLPHRYPAPRTGLSEDELLRGFDRHCTGCAACSPAFPRVAAPCNAAGESV
jgi:hypothetical protein